MRRGDSVVIDPVTRTVLSVNGEPCTQMTPELQALVEEHLGPTSPPAPLPASAERGAGRQATRHDEADI